MINYDPHKWLDHFFDIRGSMVREILGRVALCVLWSVAVVAAYKYGVKLAIPSTIHTLVGLALGLLLVFRTNASYDRFWEGRKMWGGMVNESRNLCRTALCYLEGDPARAARISRWTAAFAYATMHRLRGHKSLGAAAARIPFDEVKGTLDEEHVPFAVARKISLELAEARREGKIDSIRQVEVDRNVRDLVGYLGACERIRGTPIPFAYAVHVRRALIIYTLTIPLVLVDIYAWGAVLTTFLIAFFLFGIEEIGVEIENPFEGEPNDLPLDRICQTIERDCEAVAGPIERAAGEVWPRPVSARLPVAAVEEKSSQPL